MSEGSLCQEKYDADLAAAAEKFDVIKGTSTTLLIDLDTPEAKAQYERVLPKVVENFAVVSTQSWLSKSGNTHVLITLAEPLSPPWRLALQAALGSDGIREVLGLKRYENGIPEPSALFKPKETT